MFTYDWFHRGGLERLQKAARERCLARFDEHERVGFNGSAKSEPKVEDLESRTIIYMKDGLTYEIREILELDTTAGLTFECLPVDETYRVGAIVIVAPYEDIARVEVFAVHPDDKPQENFRIPGFRAGVQAGHEEDS